MTAVDDTTRVAELISGTRFLYQDEAGLQGALAELLGDAFPGRLQREVWIGPGERIDFMVDRIGIEVKVGGSPAAVRRQLARYAATGAIDALILVTSRVTHRALALAEAAFPGCSIPVKVVHPSWA